VTYTAATSNLPGSLSYQWHRSSDGGTTYVEIAGATARTHTLASVNLGDDGATFAVSVRSSNGGGASAVSHLAVSASPGVVLEDGEFLPADWVVSAIADPDQVPFVHSEERIPTGGIPGAYRRMIFQTPPGAGWSRLYYVSRSATYDPESQGAIYVIDYSEACIDFQNNGTTTVSSSPTIEQGGRRYFADIDGFVSNCASSTWSAAIRRASLRAQDFVLVAGPACTAGESCPDFSASALPLHFGYRRISFGGAGESIHGIDNWKVTVWRR
jgi:hypothetical protein